jgi:hypothetical protein
MIKLALGLEGTCCRKEMVYLANGVLAKHSVKGGGPCVT